MLLVCIGRQIRGNDAASLSQYLETSLFLGGEVCLRFPPVREALQFSQTKLVKEKLISLKGKFWVRRKIQILAQILFI